MIRSLATIALVLSYSTVHAHPEQDWHAQRDALVQWAETVEQSTPGSVPASALINNEDIIQVLTSYATFSPNEQGVTAGPVVLVMSGEAFRFAVNVQLVEIAGGWAVERTRGGAELPPDLIPRNLPEHSDTQAVEFSLSDASTGQGVHARVHISGPAGEYWPPDGHQKNIAVGWRLDVGGDVSISDKTYAYVTPTFTANLPPGEFAIEVRKGTEYLPTEQSFTVQRGAAETVSLTLQRWVDMNARGWYSGDTHTHFLDEHSGMLELRAEDLNMLYVLATKWGELITDVERFSGAPSLLSTDNGVLVYNEETRHGWLGHTILHGIGELVYPLSWGGPTEGVFRGGDYSPMAYQADRAHAQGGLVTWAHFPGPGGELAVDVALGKIDSVDLFTWGDAFEGRPSIRGRDPASVAAWYRFLNCGFRLPASAGTDKMLNVQVTGSV